MAHPDPERESKDGRLATMNIERKRPPRLANVFASSPLYFVTCCTFYRQHMLDNAEVHMAFQEAAAQIEGAGNAVGRYVIMPDHMHVFLRIGINGRLSVAVKCWKEFITKRLHKTQPGLKVWQPGFFDHLLRSVENYSEKWAYVRENPVRKGLVMAADLWPYQGEVSIIRW